MYYKELDNLWITLCQIHILTKHYSILAEEFGFSMKAILQPIKEQRDAYEHIVRAYTKLLDEKQAGIDYAVKNLEKAIGHEYRAFFDSIDYLTIIIREKIYKELKDYKYEDIRCVYPDYDRVKKELNSLPNEIATFREKKDIGEYDMLLHAKKYGDLMKGLLNDYAIISNDIIPKLS